MRGRWAKRLSRTVLYGIVGALSVCVLVFVFAERKLSNLVLGGLGESFSTRLYGAATVIDGQKKYPVNAILEQLDSRRYVKTRGKPAEPGTYTWADPVLSIYLRGFDSPNVTQHQRLVRLLLKKDDSLEIKDDGGNDLWQIYLEPEMIAELSGPQKIRRDPATWEEYPRSLVEAVVAVEDRRFYKHWGLDPRAIARAAWHNIRYKGLEGGSTITQQLAKNLFLKPKRTMGRKIKEAFLALYLNIRFSKERILTLYMNQIYMGQDGFVSVAGMKAAARHYFDKDLSQLTLTDSSTLAAVIRSPHHYNPFQNPEACRRRRNLVLKTMWKEGFITNQDYQEASKTKLGPLAKKVTSPMSENDYYVAEVVRQLIKSYSEDDLFRHGFKIYTAMDPLLQKIAQQAVRKNKTQVALAAIDPSNGAVLALMGGRDFRESQFNRATQALRQPGSAFKPLVYAAAMEHKITPATLLQDEPRAYSDGHNGVWAPSNFNGVYHGTVSVRQALTNSMNAATLYLAEMIGPDSIVRFASRLGIHSPIERDLSIALGTSEVSLLELTAAYQAFANGGFAVEPMVVTAVVDAEGEILEQKTIERMQVIDPALAYLMTSLMQSVITEGTAKSLTALGWTQASAGKTGTTNEGRDAWFIGYTPDLVAGVWCGNDEGKSSNLTGSKNAVPIWAAFMKEAYKHRHAYDFLKPEGVVTVNVDPISGLLPRSGCPKRSEEIFIKGTEPREYCGLHAGGLKGWFRRFFGKKLISN